MGRIRVDPRLPADLQRLIREIDAELENLRTQNIDLHRRRFLNANDAISNGDFVTRRQLDAAIQAVGDSITALVRRRRFTASSSSLPLGNLPNATHPMDYGYWIPDGDIPSSFIEESHYAENKPYTNLYLAWFRDGRQYASSNNYPQMVQKCKQLVQRAFNDGRNIKVLLDIPFAPAGDIPAHMGEMLTALAPYWGKVKYVDLADEPAYTRAQLEGYIRDFRSKVNQAGLAMPKIGATFNYQGPHSVEVTDQVFADGLDWIGVECYINPPEGGASKEDDESQLRDYMGRVKQRLGASRRLHFVMMGYGRNGSPPNYTFVDKVSLENLQRVTYLLGYNDSRVDCIDIFSYGRESGTRRLEVNGHTGIKLAHQQIWAAMTGQGQQTPPGGGGVPPGQTCGGTGNAPNCPRWCRGGTWMTEASTAVYNYIAVAPPTVIDPLDQTHVLDPPAFMAGVVSRFNTDNPALIAQVTPGNDGKEITVKSRTDNTFSDQYALWFGGPPNAYISSWTGNPPPAYRATCYPASF